MFFVTVQEWEESERGWATRPDGFRVYTTPIKYKEGTAEILRKQREFFEKGLGPNVVPDEYIRPCGEPKTVETTKDFWEKVSLKKVFMFVP